MAAETPQPLREPQYRARVLPRGPMRLRGFRPRYPRFHVEASPTLPSLTQMGIRIDLYESDGVTRVAAGPILNALQCAYGEAPSQLGGFSFQLPLNDRMAAECTAGRIAQIYIGGEGYTFQGRIEMVRDVPGERGVKEISGRSVGAELARLSTRFGLTFDDSDSFPTVVGLFLAGTSWTAGSLEAPPLTSYSRAIVGVKRYPGLLKVADLFGWLVRLDSRARTVDLGALGETSGLRFTNWEGPISPRLRDNGSVVLLQGCQQTADITARVKRVIAAGQENGISGDRVTLELATEGPPFVQSAADYDSSNFWYIEDPDSTNDGTEDVIVVKDIVPQSLTAADRIRAANALWGAAKTYLDRRSQPLRTFAISPVGLRHIVNGVDTFRVGQKARVQWRGWDRDRRGNKRRYIDIDEDLWLMGYWRTVLADGRSDWSLTVSNVPREVPSETQQLVDLYERFDASVAAPRSEFRWGGVPPIGSLTPAGIQILSDFGQQAGFWFVPEITDSPNTQDLYGYVRGSAIPDFAGEPYSDAQMGARAQGGTEDTQITLTVSADGFGNPQLHVQGLTTLDGGVTGDLYYLYDAAQQKFILTIDGQSVGGGMKSTNDGPYYLPAGNTRGQYFANDYSNFRPISELVSLSAPTTTTSNTALSAVAMPATVNANDLLIALCSSNNAGAHATPAGWTKLEDIGRVSGGGGQVNGAVFYKVAAGSEGGTTLNFSNGSKGTAHVYRILAGTYTGVPVCSADASGDTSTPNPAAVSFDGRGMYISASMYIHASGGSGGTNATHTATSTGLVQACLSSSWTNGDSIGSNDPSPSGQATGAGVDPWAAYNIAVRAADNDVAANTTIVSIVASPAASPDYLIVELATGDPGSEVSIGETKVLPGDSAFIPIDIDSGTRLSARVGGGAAYLSLQLLDQADQG